MKLPGTLIAVLIHPPKFGAKLCVFDATEARALSGVADVAEPSWLGIYGEVVAIWRDPCLREHDHH